jgi:hypothetical protein
MPKPIKYSRFREVVKDLIGIKSSDPEIKFFESKLIEYAADGHYDIYVRVACYDLADYFKMTSEDLLRFVRKPRAKVNIEKLRLYTMANETFSNIYYDVVEPDEHGIIPDYPEVSKSLHITTKMFRIIREDLPDLLEDIKKNNPFDLKINEGEKDVDLKNEQSHNKTATTKAKNSTKLRLVKNKKEVYWEDNHLPTINGKSFDILHELSKTPNKPVTNDALYEFIESEVNKGKLLNQRISKIRKTFPSPYNDIKQSECIIPDAKRNKGYCILNLTKEQTEIV